MRILAIETSCDETAIAIIDADGAKKKARLKALTNIIASQARLHARFGGVVPNLARREHEKNLVPILLHALKEAKLLNKELRIRNNGEKRAPHHLSFSIHHSILAREPELLKRFEKHIAPLWSPKIDAIAVTIGPGLAPALWVGVNFARALSLIWQKPVIPVNHMAGHLFSAFLEKSGKKNFQCSISDSQFPLLGLLVSGGHTELVLVRKPWQFRVIGETQDDAAGEAFDKVAKLLGLDYPGGAALAALAEKFPILGKELPYKSKIDLPRPMINSKDFNFSFSGLKTAVLYLLRDRPELLKSSRGKAAVAMEFQNAVVEVLVKKTVRAARAYRAKTVLLGGGVAANQHLRDSLKKALQKDTPNSLFLIPDSSLTGDNALMIAAAAFFMQKKSARRHLRADPGLKLGGI